MATGGAYFTLARLVGMGFSIKGIADSTVSIGLLVDFYINCDLTNHWYDIYAVFRFFQRYTRDLGHLPRFRRGMLKQWVFRCRWLYDFIILGIRMGHLESWTRRLPNGY